MVFFITRRLVLRTVILVFFVLIASGCVVQAERYFQGVKKGVRLEGYDLSYYVEDEVEDIVTQLALDKNCPPQNAGIDKKTGAVIAAHQGKRVKIRDTVYRVMHANVNETVYLGYEKIPPSFDERYFNNLKPIGHYITWFYGKDGRYQNIKLALKYMDNTVLFPSEIFSFNRVVGPRTPKRGFMKAPSIGIPEDYGGGVCQVATTLYNAVRKADLRVIERHEHSEPVRYVPVGNDATVNYGYLDLKFQNNKAFPVLIKTSFRKYGIRVFIYGGAEK